jgi:hypothetical protein
MFWDGDRVLLLQVLSINNCVCVEAFDFLQQLPALKHLDVSGCAPKNVNPVSIKFLAWVGVYCKFFT